MSNDYLNSGNEYQPTFVGKRKKGTIDCKRCEDPAEVEKMTPEEKELCKECEKSFPDF